MLKELKEQCIYFLKNKWFLVMLVVSAVAGYGYVLTHGTCGIDDISIDLYFEKGIGVAIGRWPYYLINKVIPIAKYTPFIGDFVTVILLMLSAIGWCVLLRILVGEKINIWAYIVFAAWFLIYSMNADVFVFYLQNGLGWVHLFTVLSLLAFLYLYKNKVKMGKQILIRSTMIILLTIAISFYESAANIFLTGILAVMLIDLYEKKKESCFRGRGFFKALFFAGRYLVYAMLARRVIRSVIVHIFHTPGYTFYRSASSIEWITKGGIGKIGENLETLLARLYCDYFAMAVVYFPILLFVICSIIFVVALLCYAWKQRDILLLITGIGTYISLFVLSVIQGDAMQYRACQTFTIFVALVFFGVTILLGKVKKQMCLCGSVILVCTMLYSVYDMNHWFVLDYEKTEYEMQVIDQIAAELNSGKYNVQEKPLVIVGDFYLPDAIYDKYCVSEGEFGWSIVENAVKKTCCEINDKYCYAQNSESMINWGIKAFAMNYGYNVPIRQFFEYRGYEFKWADPEVTNRVFETYYPLDLETYSYTGYEVYTENYGNAAQFPEKGYVEELEDCIVVRL